jgi:predicted transcriptional regulator
LKGGFTMIVFDRLWQTMKEKNISQYKLLKEYGFSSGQLDRLRKNSNVNTYTLNQLCKILDCKIEDIAEYIEN